MSKLNVGNLDRIVRLIAGLALIALPFVTQWEIWSSNVYFYLSIAIGVVFVLTGMARFCPLYRVVGANTCKNS